MARVLPRWRPCRGCSLRVAAWETPSPPPSPSPPSPPPPSPPPPSPPPPPTAATVAPFSPHCHLHRHRRHHPRPIHTHPTRHHCLCPHPLTTVPLAAAWPSSVSPRPSPPPARHHLLHRLRLCCHRRPHLRRPHLLLRRLHRRFLRLPSAASAVKPASSTAPLPARPHAPRVYMHMHTMLPAVCHGTVGVRYT